MRNFFVFVIFAATIAASCSRNSGSWKGQELPGDSPFIFRMNVFATDAEKLISFPVWFNDSIVSAQHIKKITRDLHYVDVEDSGGTDILSKEVPRERREYFFQPNGQLKGMKFTYFYDDQEIGSVDFVYKGAKDLNGYCAVIASDTDEKTDEFNNESMDFPYSIHRPEKQTDKFLAYRDTETGNYLFFMTKRKYWGPLSVDSILHPTYRDQVVLGNAYYPHKRYRVQNKVNEMDVRTVRYDKKTRMVTTIMHYEYPFEYKRSILYSSKGFCTGYIDSTFSGNEFLTRVISEMELGKSNKPVKITHRKENSQNRTGRISIELIKYE
ncbi:MAG: hypothetical protein ACK5EK_05785 [Flavobacteriia bacterium]|jgi:hypothetical protein